MKRKSRDKGIVLITTLFTLVFILMVTTTVIITSRQSVRWAGTYNEKERALNAAMSGVAYAKMRIQQFDRNSKLWNGIDPSASGTVKDPDINSLKGFTVKEVPLSGTGSRVRVEGTLTDDGPPAKFFIYFAKPQSGPVKFTKFDKFKYKIDEHDSNSGEIEVTPKYVSLNNSNKFANAKSYMADGVTEYREVPYCTSMVVVQGVCNGVEKHAEFMMLKYPSSPMDSAGISNGNMNITLNGNNSKWFVAAAMGLPALIRSNGNLRINAPVSSDDFVELNGGRAKVHQNVTLSPKYDEPVNLGLISDQAIQGTIPNFSFDDLEKFLKDTQPVTLKAGTYVFSEQDGQLRITYEGEYISNVYRETDVKAANNPYQVFSFGKDFEERKASHKVQMIAPINVVKAGNLKDIILKGPDDATYELSLNMKSTSSDTVYISNTEGDILVNGELTGKGAIFSEGDITFEGRSALSAESGVVCLYANGDINLNGFSKSIEENPEGNPSGCTAMAIEDYLDDEKKAQSVSRSDPTEYKIVDRSAEIKKILDNEITYDGVTKKLKDFLKDKYKFDKKDKQEEIVDEILRNNNNGVIERTVGDKKKTTTKIFYKFKTTGPDNYNTTLSEIYTTGDLSSLTRGKAISTADQLLKGVIYANGDFNANLGGSKFTVQGTLISKTGNISISSGNTSFLYDPQYLEPIYDLGGFTYHQLYWSIH